MVVAPPTVHRTVISLCLGQRLLFSVGFFFYISHCNRHEAIPCCVSDLHFPNDQ